MVTNRKNCYEYYKQRRRLQKLKNKGNKWLETNVKDTCFYT